ncbi:hypothetical protein SAMN02910357_00755 [Succinivibrio dextrinosolvens]|uniref:autotransporter outer membrane beta-barrel domain-containing protein n=1 Tax=Succinivibrio dextrinosolvens TaxID=83771 RepID=UPI0008EEBDC5|nr:autotransporter outer membrane beta-barrel domain-containing protein [Succinivibrio dextrinosolvens]SFS43916.1 hypothetical protein SAMN02910357_00755 [Succinivibrio dextrinosolvens]
MTYKRYYSNHRILRHTPIARYIAAVLSSSIVVWPTITLADSGGEIKSFSGKNWYMGILGTTANHVIINTDSTTQYDNAVGGYSDSNLNPGGLVRNNVLEVANGGVIKEYVYSGYAINNNGLASVTSNTLNLKNGSTVMLSAFGGRAESQEGTASSTSNRVDLENGSTVNMSVYGGYASSNTGTAWSKNNLVTISGTVKKGGTTQNYISGGWSYSNNGTATSSGNRVIIANGGSGDHAHGGYAGSSSGTANATSNILNLSGSVTKAYGGYADNGIETSDSIAMSSDNILTIYGSATDAYGGYAESRKGTATASGNIVIIEHGGIAGLNAYGGWAEGGKYDLDYGNATASGNKVIVNNGAKLGHDAYGGFAHSKNGTANASGNTVYLNTGENLNGSVYGGYADSKAEAKANNNTVILGANLKTNSLANVSLYGGYAKSTSQVLQESIGNTLEIWTKDLNVKSINNFDNYYFVIPAGTHNGDTILRIVGGTATSLSQQTNFTAVVAAQATLTPGSRISLINNENGIKNTSGNLLTRGTDYRETLKARKGVSLDYHFVISNDANNIYATVVDIKPNSQTKAIMEGRLGGLGLVNLGADLVTGEGIRQALTSTDVGGTAPGTSTVAPFSAVAAGKQRLKTGSHVDVNSISGLAGIAASKNYESMSITGGGFFEFGYARNKTFNSTDSGDVNGKGNAHYYGIGLLARLNLTDTVLKDMYCEGSIRFGRIFNDWHTNDMVDVLTGKRAEFDVSNYYYGGHLGLGYVIHTTDVVDLDLYGKVLWSHLDGKRTKVADDQYKFADTDSWRSHMGIRADYSLNDKLALYAGAAWEHEFNGDAKAKIINSTMSYDVPAPSTRGNSAVIDFGVAINNPAPGVTLGVGLTGYIGKRQGVSGSLQVSYEF